MSHENENETLVGKGWGGGGGGGGGGGAFTLSTKSLDFVFSACGGKNSLADLT